MDLAVASEPVVIYNQQRTDFLGGYLAISRARFHEPREIAHATRASRCKQMHNTQSPLLFTGAQTTLDDASCKIYGKLMVVQQTYSLARRPRRE
jgi:hypothetical protein